MAKAVKKKVVLQTEEYLLKELAQLIEQSQQQVVAQANSTLTLLFWQVGKRINENILQNKRAEYAKQIVPTLSTQLKTKYGKKFTEKKFKADDAICRGISRYGDCRATGTTIKLVTFCKTTTL